MQLLGSRLRLGLLSTAMISLGMPLAGQIVKQCGGLPSVIKCSQLSKLQTYSVCETGIHLSCCMSNAQKTVASSAFDKLGMPIDVGSQEMNRKLSTHATCYWQEQPTAAAPIHNRR